MTGSKISNVGIQGMDFALEEELLVEDMKIRSVKDPETQSLYKKMCDLRRRTKIKIAKYRARLRTNKEKIQEQAMILNQLPGPGLDDLKLQIVELEKEIHGQQQNIDELDEIMEELEQHINQLEHRLDQHQ